MPDTSQSIAQEFVRARRAAQALQDYPGEQPTSLDAAYVIQDRALELWSDDTIAGWKVGLIKSPWLERFGGENRLLGPIFSKSIHAVRSADEVEFPVFVGGFAAVEAEFVIRLNADAPRDKTQWTAEEAGGLVAQMHIAVEPAGSPLATINDLGPAVTISDFGNNAGLILGPVIADWRDRPLETLATETFIDGKSVGKGSAASLPGGPLGALAFALSRSAKRGRPLKARDLISTGATTGVHEIKAGQSARCDFGACGQIRVRAVPRSKNAAMK
jgi:2-keto-4-pentenoate hydratase